MIYEIFKDAATGRETTFPAITRDGKLNDVGEMLGTQNPDVFVPIVQDGKTIYVSKALRDLQATAGMVEMTIT